MNSIFQMFWKKKFHIISIIIISVIIGFLYSFYLVTPLYKSSTTLIVSKTNTSAEAKNVTVEASQIKQSNISVNSNLISTYNQLVKSESFINEVIGNLNINLSIAELRKNVSVSSVKNSELIKITVKNKDANLASSIANEVSKVFGEKVEKIYNLNNIYVVDKAVSDYTPYNINHIRDIVSSFVLGIILSIWYILLCNALDITIKTSDDIEKLIKVKNLNSIPYNPNVNSELITYKDGQYAVPEFFKTLRTNVQFSSITDKKARTYLVTSCAKSEGKSYVVANLGIAFAQTGKKVIIVDSNMRDGKQSEIFNISNENGLSNYISNIDSNGMELKPGIEKFIKKTNLKNLSVITSGNTPPNPADLLESSKIPGLIKYLKSYYDIIIFDCAHTLGIMDSLILAGLVDSTILVTKFDKTKKVNLQKVKSDIEDVGGKVIGTCLNCVLVNQKSRNLIYYVKKIINNIKIKLENAKKEKVKLLEAGVIPKKELPQNIVMEEPKNEEVINNCFEDLIVPNEIKGKEEIMLFQIEDEKRKKMEQIMNEKRKLEGQKRMEQLKIAKQKREEEEKALERLRLEAQKKKQEEMEKQLRLEKEAKIQEALKLEPHNDEEEVKILEARLLEIQKRIEATRNQEKLKLEEQKISEEEKRLEQLRIKKQKLEEKNTLRKTRVKENEFRKPRIGNMVENLNNNILSIKEKMKTEKEMQLKREMEEIQKNAQMLENQENSKYFGRKIMFEIDCDEIDV